MRKRYTFAAIKPNPKIKKMKKIFISFALLAVVACANAQDNQMMSKKGMPILPETGDWSIGIDAVPFIDWTTDKINIMRGNNTQLSSGGSIVSQRPMTLVGLYVVDANTAYRGKVRIGFGSTTTDNLVSQDGSTTVGAQVTDEWKHSYSSINLGVGIQKNRGKGRLRCIYGAEIGFGIGSMDDTYAYGNAFSTTNHNPTSTTNFNTRADTAVAFRTTENKAGSTFSLNLDGFIGAEYFFAPKMSFSAEYSWGLWMSSTGQGSTTTEFLNTAGTGPTTVTSNVGKSSSFALDVSNINSTNTGSIVFHWYFGQ